MAYGRDGEKHRPASGQKTKKEAIWTQICDENRLLHLRAGNKREKERRSDGTETPIPALKRQVGEIRFLHNCLYIIGSTCSSQGANIEAI